MKKGSNISKLRKKVNGLDTVRKKLLGYLLNPKDMVRGSLYEIYRVCGNPRCKCARGEKHGPSPYLSIREEGKTRLIYIRRRDKNEVTRKAINYRKYQRWMARVRKINEEIFNILKKIRDSKVKEYR